MKRKLLLFFALIYFVVALGQIPTTDLSKEYLFTNGDLSNTSTSGPTYDISIASQFSLATVSDPGNTPNNAITINNESFNGNTHPTNQGDYSLSFWIKTTDTQGGQIIEQRIFNSTFAGYVLFLDNAGAINFLGRFKYFNTYSNAAIATTNVSVNDGDWHHITVTAEKQARSNSVGQILNKYEYTIYVNGVQSAQNETNEIFVGTPVEIFDSGAALTFNPQNTSGNASAIYTGDLDNYREYTRVLTVAEIAQLASEFSANNNSVIYVDKDATGNNDGTSWQNAYTSFNTAITNLNDNDEVWVAEGVYNPINRTTPFVISNVGIKIFGGFAGTETQLSERLFGTNETIFSGDLANNDGMVRPPTRYQIPPSNKNDNAFTIFDIRDWSNASPTLFDGISITHVFLGSAIRLNGANQFKTPNLELNNCKFKFNGGSESPSLSIRNIGNNSTTEIATITINQCVFEKNSAFRGAGLFVSSSQSGSGIDGGQKVRITISNTLFVENATSEDINGSPTAYEGSSFYILKDSNKFDFTVKAINNTFVKNSDQDFFNAGDLATTVVISSDSFAVVNSALTNIEYVNNIFWDNVFLDNSSNSSIAEVLKTSNTTVSISNSLDEDGFSNIAASSTSNIITTDPLFTDSVSNVFTLQSSSPAIDTGLNTAVVGSSDLLNNQRIENITVDLGAYEYSALPCIINIPDVNFKNALLAHGITITGANISVIDTNGDGEIQCAEASVYSGLIDVGNRSITDLTGIEGFQNLTHLFCDNNSLSSIDISQNISLTVLACENNNLTTVNLLQNTALTQIVVGGNNQLASLDVSQNVALERIFCVNSSVSTIDLSNNPQLNLLNFFGSSLSSLDLSNNPLLNNALLNNNNLSSLNLANGNNSNWSGNMNATGNPQLSCIQIDNGFTPPTTWTKDATASYSTNCASLSVGDFDILSEIKIYPNPVSNILNIQSFNSTIKNLEVHNLLGQKIKQVLNKDSINVADIENGIYLLTVHTSIGFKSIRFIKK